MPTYIKHIVNPKGNREHQQLKVLLFILSSRAVKEKCTPMSNHHVAIQGELLKANPQAFPLYKMPCSARGLRLI